MRIPSLLLTKLYVKGSLRNEGEGFQFAIRNVLAPGTVVKFLGLNVDGKEYRPQEVSLLMNGVETIEAVEISSQEPLALDLGQEVIVKVRGEELSGGTREILLSFLTREVGQVNVPLRDTIEE
jgi:glycerate-2-kinase